MKKVLFILFIGFCLFSCESNKPIIDSSGTSQNSPEKELLNYELFFQDSLEFVPISQNPICKNGTNSKECLAQIEQLKSSVIAKIREIDPTIPVSEEHVRVYMQVSVYFDDLTEAQLQTLQDQSQSFNYILKKSFGVQIRRPVMQSDFIEQARRPVMQEQLRYNPADKVSTLIDLIGGGEPSSTNPTQKVWIVDTGIDRTHQDINFSSTEIGLSKDFSYPPSNPFNDPFNDSNGHGTFLAGTIGGLASEDPIYVSGYGVNGVFPNARMVSIKIFDKNDHAQSGEIASALDYILLNSLPGDIVNLSWGMEITLGECDTLNTKGIYDYIYELAAKGVYVVMSAGNQAKESLTNFPGCMELLSFPESVRSKIFTIGSVEVTSTGDYLYSSFSNFGRPSIDYLTPGEYIFTTAPGGKYALVSGTSVSTAIFSGILYHQTGIDTLLNIKRGAAAGDPDPDYPVAKVGN
ncbi:S8 family peptidase [Algoriphagus pacificus]|uniref:S8/S53 family peptidase n=1 Tax=Algoriphagus pacificus TaxID=2811234 RepID=A0ABS3CG16_9BACT|nr:S8/S53 family peptidase [Algoriphagus pacificus]MBN7816049.1 S8/S53 family peptidase [Algoriphagus pacificus]